ncbi:MAG TPA: hypothetical protein VGJ05_05720 [Fimbriiglobus sp.]|jgi:hypothetical protein
MTRLASLAVLAIAFPAFAQTKPPKLYPPDEATMKQIQEQHKTLVETLTTIPHSIYKPDVQVYEKAVDWIIRHEEYWDAKVGEKILAVLSAGQKRANELKGWKKPSGGLDSYTEMDIPSWCRVRGKPIVRGYRSGVDGSIQPYSVIYPADYDSRNDWRIDLVLHGRDAKLTELKFIFGKEMSKPVKEMGPYVQIDVYGRGNNAYRWAGESDVIEAYVTELAKDRIVRKVHNRQDNIDPLAPVVIRGFSMGGAGTWHLGLHDPFQFAAMGPGAGFSVTKGYVKNLPDPLPEYVERCLHIYDAADYAENAFHIPVIAYAGDKDPQQAATRNVQERLKKFPGIPPITFIVGKDLEHKMPPEYMAQAEAEYRKQLIDRNQRFERHIHFVTYTTRYGRAGWILITMLERHYDRTLIDVTYDPSNTVVKTENVTSFNLFQLPPEKLPKRVTVDGQPLDVPEKPAGSAAYVPTFFKESGKWRVVAQPETTKPVEKLWKYSGLQGPIDDAFMSSFVVVKPTTAGWHPERDTFLSASLNQFVYVWDKYFRGKLPTVAAADYDPKKSDARLVLFGDPQSNPLIAKVLPKLPITWTKDKLIVNGKSYDPATHVPVMIYPNPLNPGHYVVLNTGHTFSEKDLQGTNALLYPHLGDWAVIKPNPTKAEPWAYEVVDAGIFDEFWQFEKK